MRFSSPAGLALALLAGGLVGTPPAPADPVQGNGSAVFINPVQESNSAPYLSGVGTNDIKWGDSTGFGTPQNELGFTGGPFSSVTDTPFKVGTLFYFNGTSAANTVIDGVDLKSTLAFIAPAGIGSQSFTFNIPITTTPNGSGTAAGDADYITLATSFPGQVFTLGGQNYTLALTGFQNVDASNGFIVNGNELHVYEGAGATADLYGKVTLAPAATPEPSPSLAMAVGALGLAGLALARRKKVVTD